ncbi:hypothetical protein N473_01200 [Pseudoalteromonas luteoviolacea CPMOR-1]|uniref:Uncharacterized protein n=1 Tax=Pseudoalteromonas luteoviolacea CPMOR-1 TaxID=1365248 RepID=A0A167LU67_9GAMM|nr:hypothetical protein N473_01200 [Pseudoalteromonas luteoviolacea CPMOR-1]
MKTLHIKLLKSIYGGCSHTKSPDLPERKQALELPSGKI